MSQNSDLTEDREYERGRPNVRETESLNDRSSELFPVRDGIVLMTGENGGRVSSLKLNISIGILLHE